MKDQIYILYKMYVAPIQGLIQSELDYSVRLVAYI